MPSPSIERESRRPARSGRPAVFADGARRRPDHCRRVPPWQGTPGGPRLSKPIHRRIQKSALTCSFVQNVGRSSVGVGGRRLVVCYSFATHSRALKGSDHRITSRTRRHPAYRPTAYLAGAGSRAGCGAGLGAGAGDAIPERLRSPRSHIAHLEVLQASDHGGPMKNGPPQRAVAFAFPQVWQGRSSVPWSTSADEVVSGRVETRRVQLPGLVTALFEGVTSQG